MSRPQSAAKNDYERLKKAYDELEAKYRELVGAKNGPGRGVTDDPQGIAVGRFISQEIEERADEELGSEYTSNNNKFIIVISFSLDWMKRSLTWSRN